jgi:hypothetical protein
MLYGHFAIPKPGRSAQVVRVIRKPIGHKSSTEWRQISNRCDRGPARVTAYRAEEPPLKVPPETRRTPASRGCAEHRCCQRVCRAYRRGRTRNPASGAVPFPPLTGLLCQGLRLFRAVNGLVALSGSLTNINLYRAQLTADAVSYRATILLLSDPAHRSTR